MEHTSLHSYLEHRFSQTQNVTDAMVIEAKREYRALYQKRYQQGYLRKHSIITLSLSKKEREVLQGKARDKGIPLASFIKEIVLLSQSNDTSKSFTTSPDLMEIGRIVSLSYDIVEALQYENKYPELQKDYDRLIELFNQLESLLT